MCSCVEKSCIHVPLGHCNIVVIGLFAIIGLLIIGLFVLIIINKLHADKRSKELQEERKYNNEVMRLMMYRDAPANSVVKPSQGNDKVGCICNYSESKNAKNLLITISMPITKQTNANCSENKDTNSSENSSSESNTAKNDN